MTTLTYLAKIDGVTLPHIKKLEVQRSKLFRDAGRNLAGNLKATYIGVFPKVKIGFTPMGASEIGIITTLLDQSSFTLNYWDHKTQTYKEGAYYPSDFSVSLLKKGDNGLYDSFEISLVPYNKET